MLLTNKSLKKLELEGNCLGNKTAKELGYALLHNTTLRFLDLESNQLGGQDQADSAGMTKLIEGVRENKTLLVLNIANNQLGRDMGERWRDCLKDNLTLIDFEFGNNSFDLNDTRKIQEYLVRNRKLYNDARLQEWRERCTMRAELDDLEKLYEVTETKQRQQ